MYPQFYMRFVNEQDGKAVGFSAFFPVRFVSFGAHDVTVIYRDHDFPKSATFLSPSPEQPIIYQGAAYNRIYIQLEPDGEDWAIAGLEYFNPQLFTLVQGQLNWTKHTT